MPDGVAQAWNLPNVRPRHLLRLLSVVSKPRSVTNRVETRSDMMRKQIAHKPFVDLVYAHQGILQRICSVYASSPEDCEDLFQEILLQSWRLFASFDGRSKFSTWLYRVALNTALLRRRREGGKPAVVCESATSMDVALNERGEKNVSYSRQESPLPSLTR